MGSHVRRYKRNCAKCFRNIIWLGHVCFVCFGCWFELKMSCYLWYCFACRGIGYIGRILWTEGYIIRIWFQLLWTFVQMFLFQGKMSIGLVDLMAMILASVTLRLWFGCSVSSSIFSWPWLLLYKILLKQLVEFLAKVYHICLSSDGSVCFHTHSFIVIFRDILLELLCLLFGLNFGRQHSMSMSDRESVAMQGYLDHFLGKLNIVNSREVHTGDLAFIKTSFINISCFWNITSYILWREWAYFLHLVISQSCIYFHTHFTSYKY